MVLDREATEERHRGPLEVPDFQVPLEMLEEVVVEGVRVVGHTQVVYPGQAAQNFRSSAHGEKAIIQFGSLNGNARRGAE